MRKYLEGHSVIGVVLILSVFALALCLRFYDLGSQSPWSDELASWWYLRHLDEVWNRESHSHLYYGFLRIFVGTEGDITPVRMFSAIVSAIHLIEFFFLGQIVFDKKRFLLFWILVCLNPVDIIYARMARHYAWLLEGMLVFYLLFRARAPSWILSLVGAFMGFIHVFAVIPMSCLVLYRYWRERNRNILITLVSANAVLGYYLLRIFILGHDKVRSNVAWNETGQFSFWETLITQFLGDSFPRIMAYPVDFHLSALVLGLSVLLIAYKRKESGRQFLAIFLISILVIEVLSPWINLRVNRYLIYLIGFWIVALVDSAERVKDGIIYVTLVLAAFYIQYMNPFLTYPWDNEKVASWREFEAREEAVSQKLICVNPYQSEYYQLQVGEDCLDAVGKINKDEPLLYFDLGAVFVPVTIFLSTEMKVSEMIPLKNGLMAKFVPRAEHGNPEE